MRKIRLIIFALAFLRTMPSLVPAQGVGIEWEPLNNQEVMALYRAGKYDGALVVAQKDL